MISTRPTKNALGMSIGGTNFAAQQGTATIVHPALLRNAQGGVLRGFVDRIGDPVPLVASDGTTHRAEDLVAEALSAAAMAVGQGRQPSAAAVAVPAHWTASSVATLQAHLGDGVALVPDAVAAARAFQPGRELPEHGVVVVCDFGGTGSSITLLDADGGFARIGDTVRVSDFSGDLIDQALLGKVVDELSGSQDAAGPGTAMVSSLTRLREGCRVAKHRLSDETATTIPVELPGLQTTVRVTRPELEVLLAPALDEFLACLDTAVDDTLDRHGLPRSAVSAVVTIGGAARTPLITQRLSEHLRVPVVTGPTPWLTAAEGAARSAAAALAEPVTTLNPTAMAPVHAEATTAAPAADAPSALAWSEDVHDDDEPLDVGPDGGGGFDSPDAAGFTRRPSLSFDGRPDAEAPPRRRGPVLLFAAAAAAAAAALVGLGLTGMDAEPAPTSGAEPVRVTTAPVASSGVAVAPTQATVTVPAPIPVAQQRTRGGAPAAPPTTVVPAPVTTTTPSPAPTPTTTAPTTTPPPPATTPTEPPTTTPPSTAPTTAPTTTAPTQPPATQPTTQPPPPPTTTTPAAPPPATSSTAPGPSGPSEGDPTMIVPGPGVGDLVPTSLIQLP